MLTRVISDLSRLIYDEVRHSSGAESLTLSLVFPCI